MKNSEVAAILERIETQYKNMAEWQNNAQVKLDKIDIMEKDIQDIKFDISLIKDSLKFKADIDRVKKIEKDVGILKAKLA